MASKRPPVILLTYSQDRQQSGRFLYALPKEREAVRRTLEGANYDEFRYIFASSAEPAYWVGEVQDHQEKIVVFHFSGHGNSQFLQFEHSDGKAVSMPSPAVASLLTREVCPDLHLVFLNACATKEQVKHFHQVGIPAVIATPTAIRDEQAATFSDIFYRALIGGKTLLQSFKEALASTGESIAGGDVYPVHRGFELNSDEVGETTWGLFVLTEGAEYWRLISQDSPDPEASVSSRGILSNEFAKEVDWKHLHKLITRNRFREVLKRLEESVPEAYQVEVGALRGRLEELETKYIQGIHSSSEDMTEKNKFRYALLQFVKNLEKDSGQ